MKKRNFKNTIVLLLLLIQVSLFAEETGSSSTASSSANENLIANETSLTLSSKRMWRGLDVNGNGEPSVVGRTSFGLRPLSLYGDLIGSFSLWNRGEPYQTGLSDQLISRLFTERSFFDNKLGLTFGAALYYNFRRNPAQYGTFVPELFWGFGSDTLFLKPSLELYHDFTPNQSGTFWVIDLDQRVSIAKRKFDLEYRYAHANGFFKQGSYGFFKNLFSNPLHGLQDILPTFLSFQISSDFFIKSRFVITPVALASVSVNRYITREFLNVSFMVKCSMLTKTKKPFHFTKCIP